MKPIVLYTNQKAVEHDLTALDGAKDQLDKIVLFLSSKGISINETNIKNAIIKVFKIPVESFKQAETEKIKKIIDAFGETAITDGWEQKVNEKTNLFRDELVSQCPDFEFSEHINYFNFENGVEIDSKFDKQYFTDKNSTILSTPEQINFYKTHCKAVELLNDLLQHPENEFIAMDRLFFFNPETKEFEMNILQYHDIRAKREDEEKRIEGEKYNIRMQEEYRKNQIRIKLNAGEDYVVE